MSVSAHSLPVFFLFQSYWFLYLLPEGLKVSKVVIFHLVFISWSLDLINVSYRLIILETDLNLKQVTTLVDPVRMFFVAVDDYIVAGIIFILLSNIFRRLFVWSVSICCLQRFWLNSDYLLFYFMYKYRRTIPRMAKSCSTAAVCMSKRSNPGRLFVNPETKSGVILPSDPRRVTDYLHKGPRVKVKWTIPFNYRQNCTW